MSNLVEFDLGDCTAKFSIDDTHESSLSAASASGVVIKASERFADAIKIVGGLADEFSAVLEGR